MSPIKEKLHKLIDSCDDEFLLEETKKFLENASSSKDWWDELSEKDKNLVMESETQYQKKDYINHRQLMQQFEEWKN